MYWPYIEKIIDIDYSDYVVLEAELLEYFDYVLPQPPHLVYAGILEDLLLSNNLYYKIICKALQKSLLNLEIF